MAARAIDDQIKTALRELVGEAIPPDDIAAYLLIALPYPDSGRPIAFGSNLAGAQEREKLARYFADNTQRPA